MGRLIAVTRFSEPIFHVDMDAFFVEVERLRNPALRGVAVAVGATGGRGVVASASYEARKHGVRSAMPMAHARRACPGLLVVSPDHGEYRRVSEEVFEVLRGFTPAVEAVSVDEAYLDVSGLRLHYPSAESVGTEIRIRLREELGLPASVGIASNKLLAKLASEAAKPDGLRVIRVEDQDAFLRPLTLTALPGVGSATAAALKRLGAETVDDLLGLPESAAERSLGPAVARHLADMARGIDTRPVISSSEARSISTEETFDADVSDRSEVEVRLALQVDRLASRVRRAGLKGRTVTVKLRLADFTTSTRSMTLDTPTHGTAEMTSAALALLARMDFSGQGVRLVGVGLTQLSDAGDPVQMTLGDEGEISRLDEVIDEIRDKYRSRGIIATGRTEPGKDTRS